jgi:hypothetical protein
MNYLLIPADFCLPTSRGGVPSRLPPGECRRSLPRRQELAKTSRCAAGPGAFAGMRYACKTAPLPLSNPLLGPRARAQS